METLTKTNIFDGICNPEDNRLNLRRPFYHEGRTYATDGFILAYIDGRHAEELEAPLSPPDLERVLAFRHEVARWAPLPEPETVVVDCPECGGKKKYHCPECEGKGNILFYSGKNSYIVICKTCAGLGKAVKYTDGELCPVCKGAGRVRKKLPVPCGHGAVFNPVLLYKLKTLPNCEIEADFRVKFPDTRPAMFRFKGGEGFIMPLLTWL